MRLFIAVDVPEDICSYLLKIQSGLDPAVKKTGSFHMTLKFLGDAGEQTKDRVTESLEKIKAEQFELELSELGAFPGRDYIRVIWIGTKENPILMKLQKDIENALESFGFKKELDFHPHLTLARVQTKMDFPDIKIENKKFKVDRFIL